MSWFDIALNMNTAMISFICIVTFHGHHSQKILFYRNAISYHLTSSFLLYYFLNLIWEELEVRKSSKAEKYA